MIKEIRDIETGELKGYNKDGLFIPLDSKNRYYKEVQKLIKEDAEVFPAYSDEERLDYFKRTRLQKLLNLADKKTQEVKNTLAGFVVTQEQAERYRIKYQEAIKAIENDDYSFFEAEAKLLGIEAEDLVKQVKEAGDNWNAEINKQISLIEAYRVKAKSIILSLDKVEQFKVVDKYLEEAKNIASITIDGLESIFEDFEKELNEI